MTTETAGASSAPESAATIDEAARLREEAARLRDDLLRARAEAENVRKRARADALLLAEAAAARIVEAVLPVLEGLDRAAAAAPDEGVRHLARLLRSALEAEGVEIVAPAVGERFDPLRHEAVERRETEAAAEGTVVEVLAPGALLRGRLLRSARVAVAVAPVRASSAPAPSAPAAG